MSLIGDLFTGNLVLIFFVYGLSFFALGITLLLQSLGPIRLAGLNHLWLLAAFGLLHAAHEWMAMAALVAPQASLLATIALGTLFVSFTPLLQFGISSLADRRRWIHVLPLLLLATIAAYLFADTPTLGGVGSPAWLAVGEALARYGLGLPGSLITGWVLWQIGRSWKGAEGPRISRLFARAAVSFALYGILAGAIVSPAPFFPASSINSASFLAATGIPIQAIRALCALSITYFLIRVYFLEAARYLNTAYVEEKERVRQLQELDQLKNEFISFVSHEFRQPLVVIKGWAQYLLRQPAANIEEESVQRALDAIYRQAGRLADLVENVLNLSRMESGRLPFQPSRFRLAQAIEAVAQDMDIQAQTRGIRIQVEGDDGIEVYADPDLTRQILVNLIGNAIKYAFENTAILVRARRENGMAQVSVHDEGPGIPPDQLPRLFGRFIRLARPGEPQQPGAGLGLYITKRMVEMQDGRTWVESEVGKGSTFYFTLPVA